jgi:hypothetical protein
MTTTREHSQGLSDTSPPNTHTILPAPRQGGTPRPEGVDIQVPSTGASCSLGPSTQGVWPFTSSGNYLTWPQVQI